jgi:hypothetical protein
MDIRLPATVFSLLLFGTAQAQIYKWTDEKGAVHYSSSPPAEGATANRRQIVEERVTSTSPSAQPSREPAPESNEDLRKRVLALEQQLETERRSKDKTLVASDERAKREREECERQRRIDCDRPEVIQDGPRQVIIVPSRRNPPPGAKPPPTAKPAPPPTASIKIDPSGKQQPLK